MNFQVIFKSGTVYNRYFDIQRIYFVLYLQEIDKYSKDIKLFKSFEFCFIHILAMYTFIRTLIWKCYFFVKRMMMVIYVFWKNCFFLTYRVLIKYCVFSPKILESLPPLPRQHSTAIGCTKNYQPIGETVYIYVYI